MKVIWNNSCLVKPSEPTWNGRMPLTEPDQIGIVTHFSLFYVYKNSCPTLPNKDSSTIFSSINFKTSLSRVLVHFYPLAGRLRWLEGSHLDLDCNGEGVQLIEALCDAKLDDLGDFTPSTPDHFNYLIPQIDYKAPIEEIPLLIVQLTKFSCAGLTLCFTISHAVTDGKSAYHFITEWARLARGEPLGTPPFLDRKVLRAGDPPLIPRPDFQYYQHEAQPQLIGHASSDESDSKKETTIAMLKLSKSQVEMLKNEANKTRPPCGDRAYTRYESIVGHIWRTACKARGHAHEQPTAMGVCADIRRRMQPPLPDYYFGNAIEFLTATDLSGELVKRSLGYAAGKIRQALDSVTNEYVHSAIDYLKNLKDLSGLQDIHAVSSEEGVFYGNPNIEAISWMGLPLYGLDFGWGKEIFMAPVMSDGDGDSLVLPGYDGDGSLVVVICLQSAYMEDFKKIFYQVAA